MSDSRKDELAFDPDQSVEETRRLRQSYRDATKKIDVNSADITTDSIEGKLQIANELFKQVKQPKEATLDANFLHIASNIGTQKARALKSGTGAFELDDFLTKLVSFMGGNKSLEDELPDDSESEADPVQPLKWDRIGRRAVAYSHRVPITAFMHGPLATEQKKRGPMKRSKLEKAKGEERRPMVLTEEDIERSTNETSKNVAVLASLLETLPDESINLFKFVINPNDFAQSVENIFYLSFLIRDGKVALETRDGEPIISPPDPCEEPKDTDYEDGLKKSQMVLEFDMATWRKAIKVFDIQTSIIPQRPKAMTRLGNKWVG